MKKIDTFLIRAFIPPFIAAFGIALFVLVMQFLWVYIDDIMGKGVSLFALTELIFYLSMTMVPLALPIGVLIATVMVLGGLGEHYELSSLKSAGVSLSRIMRPLGYAVALITIFSFVCSDRIIPWANLKFHTRFYDIRRQKPTLALEAGVFNSEFGGYTMRIGEKDESGRFLKNIMIYENGNMGRLNQTIAKEGEMYNTDDKQYIVMNLKNGTQYQEPSAGSSEAGGSKLPFIRINYVSWEKIFDLSQFEKGKTDENLFKGHQKMLSSRQLYLALDSIDNSEKARYTDLNNNIREYFTSFKNPELNKYPPKMTEVKTDTGSVKSIMQEDKMTLLNNLQNINQNKNAYSGTYYDTSAAARIAVNKKLTPNFFAYQDSLTKEEKGIMYGKAVNQIKGQQGQIDISNSMLLGIVDSWAKFSYELHTKYAMAAICFIFLFIGAPMGAIVQKGGFGLPILIAISFFMLYMISVIYCKNLNDTHTVSAPMAAWLPDLLMIPIGVILTYRAMNDYKIVDIDGFFAKLKIVAFIKKKFSRPTTA